MTTAPVKKVNREAEIRKNEDEFVTIPPVDIYETETEYVIKADIPGVKKEDIEVEFNNNRLEIRGKSDYKTDDTDTLKYSEFTINKHFRSFKVGNDIDSEKIEAAVRDGVLMVVLHKRDEVKPRKITVKAS